MNDSNQAADLVPRDRLLGRDAELPQCYRHLTNCERFVCARARGHDSEVSEPERECDAQVCIHTRPPNSKDHVIAPKQRIHANPEQGGRGEPQIGCDDRGGPGGS
jgi:hypothetical protein